MSPRLRTPSLRVVLVALLAVAAPACGGDSDEARGGQDDVQAFCDAVEALDATDGTTEDQVVIDALEDLKRTAPDGVRDDVVMLADTLLVKDYPDAADDSMEAARPEASRPASERLEAYVSRHCDLPER